MSKPTNSLSPENSPNRPWWRSTNAKDAAFVVAFAVGAYLVVHPGADSPDVNTDLPVENLPYVAEPGDHEDGSGSGDVDIYDARVQCLGEGAVRLNIPSGIRLGPATKQLPGQPPECRT